MYIKFLKVYLVYEFLLCVCVEGHGMMLYPPMRGSMWRFFNNKPINYDDNGLNCGYNYSSCGVCGDGINQSQRHSLFGIYGVHSRNDRMRFLVGQEMVVAIKITTNHGGYFYYEVCNLDIYKYETERCFKFLYPLQTYLLLKEDKSTVLLNNLGTLKFKCVHCVLRWSWITNSNWAANKCNDVRGCGEQEIFKNCADFSIE